MFSPQEDPTGQKYGRLEEEGGMGPDKVASNIIIKKQILLQNSLPFSYTFSVATLKHWTKPSFFYTFLPHPKICSLW